MIESDLLNEQAVLADATLADLTLLLNCPARQPEKLR